MAKKKKVVKKDKGAKVKDEDAVRDINSGAIVFNNQAEYQQAVRRKRLNLTNNKNNSELRSLRKQVAALTNIVNQLINNKD